MAEIVQSGGDGHGEAHGGHDHHGSLPQLQHHFETEAQQFDASKLGMWLFLITEILFFSGLFCAYAIYRATHPRIFEVGAEFLDTRWGAINTVVLILSSFTMALAVWAAQTSRKGLLTLCLGLTWLGALGFMVIKYVEYSDKIQHGKVWGAGFNPVHHYHDDHHDDHHPAAPLAAGPLDPLLDLPAELEAELSQVKLAASGMPGLNLDVLNLGVINTDPPPLTEDEVYQRARDYRDMQIFFGIYYAMTGLHGIHVVAGMVVIGWLFFASLKGRFHSEYYTPVDLTGLYWHVVDLVWIFLFPLLYLID